MYASRYGPIDGHRVHTLSRRDRPVGLATRPLERQPFITLQDGLTPHLPGLDAPLVHHVDTGGVSDHVLRPVPPDDFQQEVAFFGIESSPSFVREPEGNGVAERFIRTLKENLLWVRSFDTIEELRLALLEFKRTYNEQWMLEKYHYQSPAQVRRDFVGLDAAA